MPFGGDPDYLRDIAQRLRSDAERIDGCADRTRLQYGIAWQGPASERFRDRVETLTRGLGEARDSAHEAARAVDKLADELAEEQHRIAVLAERVRSMVQDAENTIEGLVGRTFASLTHGEMSAYHAANGILESIPSFPAPGSPDWVDLARRIGA